MIHYEIAKKVVEYLKENNLDIDALTNPEKLKPEVGSAMRGFISGVSFEPHELSEPFAQIVWPLWKGWQKHIQMAIVRGLNNTCKSGMEEMMTEYKERELNKSNASDNVVRVCEFVSNLWKSLSSETIVYNLTVEEPPNPVSKT